MWWHYSGILEKSQRRRMGTKNTTAANQTCKQGLPSCRASSPHTPVISPPGDRIEEVGLCLKPVGEKKPRLWVSGGSRKPKTPPTPPRNIRCIVLNDGSKHKGCRVCEVLPRPALAPSICAKCSVHTVQNLTMAAARDLLRCSFS